jgi:DNA-binding NarL/FixJ family response regulator
VAIEPAGPELPYREILTSIIQRFIRLIGAPAALTVARRTPQLIVDEEGNVLSYNEDDALGTITQLIDSYGTIFGDTALALSRQAVRPIAAAAPERALQDVGLLPQRHTPITIMVVDDAVLFRESLLTLLQQQPEMTVVGQAGSVEEAVTAALRLKPEMILMDFSLPDGTGLDATLAILAQLPKTKIVFLTVHEDDERLFGAIRAGAAGYVFKNARAAELVKTLRGVARGEVGISRALARRILDEFARTPSQPSEAEAFGTVEELTARELDIVRELARGLSNHEIADKFVISENTVKNHVRNVLGKLHLHSRREIANYARTHGLTSAPPSDRTK